MNSKLFPHLIFIRMDKGMVHKLATIDDAIEFLENSPEKDHDFIHETMLRAYIEAHVGPKRLHVARGPVRAFTSKKGILENPSSVMPWLKAKPTDDAGRSVR